MRDLFMSTKEADRLTVFIQVTDNKLLLKEAAVILGLSYRQTKRTWQLFKHLGKEVLVLIAERNPDFGPTFAAEMLLEHHDIRLSKEKEGTGFRSPVEKVTIST